MSAPEPPPADRAPLSLFASRSARDSELRSQRGQRGQLEPGRQQVEIGVTSGRGSRRGALGRDLAGDRMRIRPTAQADGQQAGSIGEPLADELLEPKPKLRLVGAGRQIGHTVPLLAEAGKLGHEPLERRRVGVQEQLAPDQPDRRSRAGQPFRTAARALLSRLIEALRHIGTPEPRTRPRDARWSGDGGERAEAHGIPKQALGIGIRVQPDRTVEQAGTIGTDAERRALEARRRAWRARAERVATEERRKFVSGREEVRGFAQRSGSERHGRAFGSGESREALRNRDGVHRPVPIDEFRAARRRRGEDRV